MPGFVRCASPLPGEAPRFDPVTKLQVNDLIRKIRIDYRPTGGLTVPAEALTGQERHSSEAMSVGVTGSLSSRSTARRGLTQVTGKLAEASYAAAVGELRHGRLS